ncbi:hypothetical protein BDZ85DRAFT_320130 [Elsinoe ampelina]|uniref:Uncharacterized protein n=1 Tax=Elsinoe ampelina TaxID=302913 RepID=A0A6A6G805_9PEZI|nr:hypothetical protein BDZ85DRAFT_320130 [Elsinoe ampelina]
MLHSIHSTLAVALLTGLAAAQDPTPAPAEFTLKPVDTLYQGGAPFAYAPGSTTVPVAQSPRFAIYGPGGKDFNKALNNLEMAYECFVNTLGWKSSGVSTRTNIPGYFKTNFYQVQNFTKASVAGQQYTDSQNGRGYVGIGTRWVEDARVSIHEYGHVLHYHERTWTNTDSRPWWESLASFVADYALNGEYCAPARSAYNITSSTTNIDFTSLISNSFLTIVDSQPSNPNINLYKAWPFFTYLTNNPDRFPQLGRDTVRSLFRQWRTPETPLHTLQTVAGPSLTVQTIVASYWARVAYADLWHEPAAIAFNRIQRSRTRGLDYANLDSTGTDTWRVKPARAPRYMGASFVPLSGGDGPVAVKVSAAAAFEARIAVRARNYGSVRYVYVRDGQATVEVAATDEVMLVVVNAPAQLIQYNPNAITGSGADAGLDFSVQVTGAVVGDGAAPVGATGVRVVEANVNLAVATAGEEEVGVMSAETVEIFEDEEEMEVEDELAHLECGGKVGGDDEEVVA